jgi:hypothetical protein
VSNPWLAIDVATAPLQRAGEGDGVGRSEIDRAACAQEPGWDELGSDDLEEVASAHYGRIAVLDDRHLVFADPRGVAHQSGFDQRAVS